MDMDKDRSNDSADSVAVTAAVGRWTNALIRQAVTLFAAAGRMIPDFHVGYTANPKGPRLRVKLKDGTLGSLKLPCYVIAPLSGETADALAIDAKTGEPNPKKKRTLKVAPRFTLDRTYRGLVDIVMAANTKKDTTSSLTMSERIYALVMHIAAQVNQPPRCTTTTTPTKGTVSKMIMHPEGWKDAARIVGLDVDNEKNADPKYTLSDVGLQACRALLKEIGPFPLSGLGALDTNKDDRPKQWAEALSTVTGKAFADKNGKPFKIRIPRELWALIDGTTNPEGSGFVSVRLFTRKDDTPAATVSVASNIAPKRTKPARKPAPQPDAEPPAPQASA